MKVNMTKKRIIYTIVVTLIVVFSTTFAILMTLERTDYRNYLQGQYSKSMYELISAVENIEDNLSKAAIVGTREQRMLIFGEIFRHAANASDKLHSLPVPQETLNETSKFVSQVGDFCYTLVRSSMEGKDLTDEQYNTIDTLSEQSYKLRENLNVVLGDINEGRVKWGEIRKKVTGVLAKEEENLVSEKFKGIQKQISQYPALIYDGPFSDNVLEITPKVNEEKEISKEEAVEKVRNIIGKDRVEKIEEKPSQGNTKIDSYGFNVMIKGRKREETIAIDISKRGGKIIALLDNKVLGKPTIDEKQAVDIGAKYLGNIGYSNMIPTYSLKYEDNITVSYIYSMEDVLIYPDQIKLKISLDDGSVIGVEADKYLVAHSDKRQLPNVKITAEDGKKNVGKRLEINNIKLVVIPTEINTEVLCYEYSGSYKDNNFKVYINAETGDPQRIIKIINTPNGQLAM